MRKNKNLLFYFEFFMVFMLVLPILNQNLATMYRKALKDKSKQIIKVTKGNLSISHQHYHVNNQSLRWDWQSKSSLQIISPPINPKLILDYKHHTTQIWIYNEEKSTSSIKFQYLDAKSVVNYHFQFRLNYQGWRRLTRSYLYDMNKIKNSAKNISLIRVRSPSRGSGSLFFGQWDFVIPRVQRIASRQMPDVSGFYSTNSYLLANNNIKDIQISEITPKNQRDLLVIKNKIQQSLKSSPPTDIQLQKAEQYYQNLQLVLQNSMIKGKFTSPVLCKSHLYTFVRHFIHIKNITSLQKAERIIWLINDFGFAYGSELVYGWYDTVDYFNGVLLIYPYLNSNIKSRIFPAIRWTLKMKQFWQSNPKLGWDSDYVHTNLRFALGSIVICLRNRFTTFQWLYGFKRFLQRKSRPSEGIEGWLKPDGTFFHHNAHYIAYMYSFNSFVNILNFLNSTQFQINEITYKTFRDAAYNLLIFSNKFQYSNSLCGRHPFSTTIPMTQVSYKKLAKLGGTILGVDADQKITGVYNRLWGNSQFPNHNAQNFPQGFWQFNYSPSGIYRRNDWVATIRGFNSILWGSEIYKSQNRYGRYQSYGNVQIMYKEGASRSGYIPNGYNWNLVPGTTTKMLGWTQLMQYNQITHQKAASNFSGALRFLGDKNQMKGKYGMYSFDFIQSNQTKTHDPTFVFKKSMFCFDEIIICLGSNIHSIDNAHPVVTTLFQQSLKNKTTNIVIDGKNISDFPYTGTLKVGYHWFIDPTGTGYFVKSKKTIFITKSNQTSPNQSNQTQQSGLFATAYMSHGTSPKNSSYQYVIVPGTNVSHFRQLLTKLAKPIPKNQTKPQSKNKTQELNISANTTSVDNKQNKTSHKGQSQINEINQNQTTKYQNTVFKIIQANQVAHIVHYLPENIYAYSLFTNNSVLNDQFIMSNNGSCMVMLRKAGKDLNISIVDPLFLYHNKSGIKIVINGTYTATNLNNQNQTSVKLNNNTTQIQFITEKGNPVDIFLTEAALLTKNNTIVSKVIKNIVAKDDILSNKTKIVNLTVSHENDIQLRVNT